MVGKNSKVSKCLLCLSHWSSFPLISDNSSFYQEQHPCPKILFHIFVAHTSTRLFFKKNPALYPNHHETTCHPMLSAMEEKDRTIKLNLNVEEHLVFSRNWLHKMWLFQKKEASSLQDKKGKCIQIQNTESWKIAVMMKTDIHSCLKTSLVCLKTEICPSQ